MIQKLSQERSVSSLIYRAIAHGVPVEQLMTWYSLTKKEITYYHRLGKLMETCCDEWTAEQQARDFADAYASAMEEKGYPEDRAKLYAEGFAEGMTVGRSLGYTENFCKNFAEVYTEQYEKTHTDKNCTASDSYTEIAAVEHIERLSTMLYQMVHKENAPLEYAAKILSLSEDTARLYLQHGEAHYTNGLNFAKQMKYSDESNAVDFADLYVHGLCVACDHNLTGDKANVFASNFADGAMLERASLLSQIRDAGTTLAEHLEKLGDGENVAERYLRRLRREKH